MLQGEHYAILSTFIKLPFVIQFIFCFVYFEWSFYTGFTVELSFVLCTIIDKHVLNSKVMVEPYVVVLVI